MIRPITQESMELIRHFEGFYSKPYLCPAGVATIGIGTVAYPSGKKVTLQDALITEEKAYEYLMHELKEKADTIHAFLLKSSVLLSDQQYSALVSFAYNCGCGPIVNKEKTLHSAILTDNPLKIADAFLVYDKAPKIFPLGIKRYVVLPGLTRRRRAERHLFLNGVNNFFAEKTA